MHRRAPVVPVAAATLALLGSVLMGVAAAAPAAAAADGPGRFAQAQVGLDYTVYRPTTTLGLKRSSFQLFICGTGDESISADYGSQTARTSRWIGLAESARPCEDGPDGVATATTFRVRGATATVAGDCPGQMSTCTGSRTSVRRGAYTTVTLPSGGDGLSSTFVEVYTQAITLKQLKAFVRGLVPVQ